MPLLLRCRTTPFSQSVAEDDDEEDFEEELEEDDEDFDEEDDDDEPEGKKKQRAGGRVRSPLSLFCTLLARLPRFAYLQKGGKASGKSKAPPKKKAKN